MRRRFLNNIKSISGDNHSEYFAIEALEDGLTAKLSINACEYRIDNGSWNNLSANSNTPSINKGQTLSFKGNLTPNSSNGIGTFTISKKCNLKGNIMSLLYGDDFIDKNDLTGKTYAFYKLFYYCTIVNASELILPATTLAGYCYENMFCGCTSLTEVPALPATTLADHCYSNMFQFCVSLTTAPALPATTLAYYCYFHMFNGCNNLTSAPALPSTTLAEGCYRSMFEGCKGLTTAPELPATTLASDCYYYMFYGCTSLTIAPALPATTLAEGCYYGMFSRCTSLTTAPALPSTTLTSFCYADMFSGCTSLTIAPELPATTLVSHCYQYMFRGCTGLTSAPELPATTLANYCYQYMFNGCSKLNYIKMLATGISATNCLNSWVDGVASSGTFVKHPDMTSLPSGTSGIPEGWNVEDYVVDYTSSYFAIEALEDGLTVQLSENTSEYRIDNGEWITLSADINTPSINKGQTLSFRGNLTPTEQCGIGAFTISKKCNLKGNIMSLLYGDDFIDKNDLTGKDFAFFELFYNCTTLKNAENLILPATELANYCYNGMFSRCTSLTTAPALPSTTLAKDCYSHMFSSCISLTTAPALPSTTLVEGCYYGMFYGCISLTTAPGLISTTLADNCYSYMFEDCHNLNYIKMLATDISADYCLDDWVSGVASSGTVVKHPDMTSLSSGRSGIPDGWVVEDYVETNLIIFRVIDKDYQAEEGMTWNQWLFSEYNTINAYESDHTGYIEANTFIGSGVDSMLIISYQDGSPVLLDDIIINNYDYTHMSYTDI